jgi:hypothetical protein
MDLGTFGAVLKYAIQLENSALKLYESVLNLIDNERMKLIFVDLSKQNLKRIVTLKRLRCENTTEMILEPIYGLESDNYSIINNEFEDISDFKEIIIKIENTLNSFYQDASEKIDFLSEVAYTFEDFAEQNLENINLFQNL